MARVAPAIAAFFILPVALSGQDTQWNRYTLEDLDGVFVRAEATSTCEAAGLSVADVQTAAATTLQDAEVTVLTREAMLETPGLPELRISLECSEENGALAYAVSLRVQQAAQMIRDPQVTLPEAVTWYSTTVGIADSDGARSAMGETIDAKLEEFGAAWIAANTAEVTPGSR